MSLNTLGIAELRGSDLPSKISGLSSRNSWKNIQLARTATPSAVSTRFYTGYLETRTPRVRSKYVKHSLMKLFEKLIFTNNVLVVIGSRRIVYPNSLFSGING